MWYAVGTIGAAVVGGVVSNMAAKKSASAAKDAANTSAAAANNATALQKDMYEQTREDQAPWRDVGASGVNQLAYLMGLPSKGFETGKVGPSKMGAVTAENFDPAAYLAANPDVAANQYFRQNPAEHFDRYGFSEGRQQMLPGEKIYTQTAPVAGTGERGSLARNFALSDFQKDPGYDFRLSEGIKALDRSAAARGGLLSGAQLKGLNRYNQDYASNEYQNAYNRYQSNQTNQFNRLAAISGVGQTANNALQQAGGQYATNASNIGMTNAANVGNAQLAAGQATASAYQGYGNALSGLARNYANNNNQFGSSGSSGSYDPGYSYNNSFGSSGSSGGYDPGSDWNYNDAQSNVSFYGGN